MEEGIVRKFGVDMYTLLYLKWITTRTYCIAHGTLLNVMWQTGWEGSLGENICMTESLRCQPEAITTLFVDWLCPNTK